METQTTYKVSSNGSGHNDGGDAVLPPHNLEAEAALISSILVDPSRFEELEIEPQMFFDSFHREIYRAFADLRGKKQTIDILAVMDVLHARDIERDGDLIGLMSVAPTSSNIMVYAGLVQKYWNRRRTIRLAGKVASAAFDLEEELDDTLSVALDGLRVIGGDMESDAPKPAYILADQMLDTLTNRRANPAGDNGLATGFLDLDRLLGGIEKDAFVVFAGRPGSGKSMFEQAVRDNVAKSGKRVAVFNLEMSGEQVVQRMLASRSQLNYQKFKTGQFNEAEWVAVGKAIGEMSKYSMYVDDTPSLGIDQLEAKCHRLFAEHGYLDLITVDYLQLMTGSAKNNKRSRNRVEEVGEISRGLKRLAKDLNTVVWANAQVNRSVEHRQIRMPVLADLRESGDIEQDADIVMFITRDEMYNSESMRPNIAEIGVAKNRNGSTGQVDLFFDGQRMRFKNLATNIDL